MRQVVYQVCYTSYQVSFYLWRIGPVLNIAKFQNIMSKIVDAMKTLIYKLLSEKSTQSFYDSIKKNQAPSIWNF